MADPRSFREDFLEDNDRTSASPVEQLGDKAAQMRDRLSALKQQEEQLERERQKYEELSHRQDQFESGRAEMVDKFTSSLVQIQRETDETLKRLEILKNVRDSFSSYLQELEAINPKDWAQDEIQKELSRANGTVEDARSVFVKAQAQVVSEHPVAGPSPYDDEFTNGGQGFGYWLMAGIAFTLPLTAIGLLGLVLWFMQLQVGGH